MPLPTSLVFDDRRRLVAVIKGPAGVEQLIESVQPSPHLTNGKWIIEPNYDLAFMASMLLENDALDDAMQYLAEFKDDFFRGQRYATVMAQVGTRLVAVERIVEAEPYFQAAVDIQPDNAEWLNDLATTEYRQGKTARALVHFQAAA